jgi:peptidoglycan/LPS O-acetylase OafA/YrhL
MVAMHHFTPGAYAKIPAMRSTLPYRPDIDGLRAIAVVAVLAYHLNSTWLPGGFVGVDVFFVISGFVVSAALARSPWDARGGFTAFAGFIGRFYARRLARIMPALVLVLVTSTLAASLFIPRAWLSGLSEETALFAFWGLSNWRLQSNTDFYFAPRAEFNPYTQTWSLGVEEQFYLIAPLLFFFWVYGQRQHQANMQTWSLGILSLLTLISLALCAYATQHHPALAFYFIGARFWELALGALLFFMSAQQTSASSVTTTSATAWHPMVQRFLPWLGLGAIVLACLLTEPTAFPWPWALLAVLGTLAVIGGQHADGQHPVRRLLSWPALVWVGRRSYSLYLWHWPVFVLLRWTTGLETGVQYLLAVIITVLLSLFSYRYVEQALRHNAWIERRSNALIIAGFLLLPLGGTLLSQYFFSHLERVSLSTVSRTPSDWYGANLSIYTVAAERPCEVSQTFVALLGGMERIVQPRDCKAITPASSTIYVLGDSHAGAIIPLLEQTSAALGVRVRVFSYQGTVASSYACSYLDLQAPMEVGRAPGCLEFNQAVRERIRAEAKPGDLVLLPSLRMQRYGDQWASFGIANMHDKMYSGEALALRAAAAQQIPVWLDPLLQNGVRVAFMAPTPIFQAPTFRCADWFNAHNPICIGNNQQARAEMEKLRKPILETMHGLAAQSPAVLVWDPFTALCPGDVCTAVQAGKPLFFDGDHLSNYGNWVLYPHFVEWLKAKRIVP